MVEAAGIEPASANSRLQALHVYRVKSFKGRLPNTQSRQHPSLMSFNLRTSAKMRQAIQ